MAEREVRRKTLEKADIVLWMSADPDNDTRGNERKQLADGDVV